MIFLFLSSYVPLPAVFEGSGEQSRSSRGKQETVDSKMTFTNALFVPFAHSFHCRQLVSSAGIWFFSFVISTHFTLGQSEKYFD